MKLPATFVLRLLPVHSSLAAAVALTAVYGTLSIVAYAFFGVWDYKCALVAPGEAEGFVRHCTKLVQQGQPLPPPPPPLPLPPPPARPAASKSSTSPGCHSPSLQPLPLLGAWGRR